MNRLKKSTTAVLLALFAPFAILPANAAGGHDAHAGHGVMQSTAEAALVDGDVNAPRIQSLFETDLPYLVGAAPAPRFVL